ncbi:MAG: glycosyltransferase family 2 protein [Bacteroidetes bacterium]|nr:glycosyltransferase family 2 protein [Bacteroidota bacterium]
MTASAGRSVFAVILNYRSMEMVLNCIAHLRSSDCSDMHLVVVDNDSQDGGVEELKQKEPGVTVIESPANHGYSAGNNIGIRYALDHGATHILILNPDTEVGPVFLRPLLEEADRDAAIGAVTCKVINKQTGAIYPSGAHINPWFCAVVPLDAVAVERRQSVTFISGCVMLVKAEVFNAVGLLNEEYFLYQEDVEFSSRVGQRYSMHYVPSVSILHHSGGGDDLRSYTPLYLFYSTRNRFLFYARRNAVWYPYVLAVSSMNVVLKAVRILLDGRWMSEMFPRLQLLALFDGFRDGVLLRTHRNFRY